MSFTEKLPAVRQAMEAAGADSLLLSALDEIAWLLNIRGNDVHCNPVVVSYLLIEKDKVNYFVQPTKGYTRTDRILQRKRHLCAPV